MHVMTLSPDVRIQRVWEVWEAWEETKPCLFEGSNLETNSRIVFVVWILREQFQFYPFAFLKPQTLKDSNGYTLALSPLFVSQLTSLCRSPRPCWCV